jgi:hypothetical protein
MASNSDASQLGTLVDGFIRKITTNEQANTGQTVIADKDVIIIDGSGVIGTENLDTAAWVSQDSIYLFRGTGVDLVGNGSGTSKGNITFNRDKFFSLNTGNLQIFFNEIIDCDLIFSTPNPIFNFRARPNFKFTGNRVEFPSSGTAAAMEVHGNGEVKDNTFINLTGGFLHFSSAVTNIEVEGQNFIGVLNRLGFTNGATNLLTFIDCLKDGSYFTQSGLQSTGYLSRGSNAFIFFAKRQQFDLVDSEDNQLVANITYKGAAITDVSYDASSVNHKQDLFRSNQSTGSATTGQVVLTNWVYFISGSQKITRKIFKYGYLTQVSEWGSYDEYPRVAGIIKVQSDSSIVERDASVVSGYDSKTEMTAEELYDYSEYHRNLPANIDSVLKISRSGTELDFGTYDVVFDSSATNFYSVSGNTVTLKLGSFTGSLKTTGTVTTNGVNVTGGVIDSNGDSFVVERNGSAFSLFSSVADRLANANHVASNVTRHRFNFTTPQTLYVRLESNGLFTSITIKQGENEFDLGTAGSIAQLESKIDEVIQKKGVKALV